MLYAGGEIRNHADILWHCKNSKWMTLRKGRWI